MAKKSKVPLTAQEQYEMELQVETDLGRLQRQHRILERDRSGYTSGGKLQKQRHVIEILNKERNNVMKDLFVATCSTKKTQDGVVKHNLCGLLQEHDSFDALLKEKKAHLDEIDCQIGVVRKQVVSMRSKQITDEQYQARVLNGQKTAEGLENKLDTAIKRFCTILAENRKMRQQIDHLLLERVNFNKIWENLIKNLNKGKKFMMDLIEQATIAYDHREEWCTKLQALRTRAHTDLIMHTQEMQDLQRKLAHDGKLEEFLGVKGQKRIMQDLELRELKKREAKKLAMQKQLEGYKEILANILEFTEAEDVHSLVVAFVKQEEENFTIFNFINAMYKEMETLTDDLVQLHINIDTQRALNETRVKRQTDKLEKLRTDLAMVTEKANQKQNVLDGTDSTLQSLYKGVGKLFALCKCSNAPFMELLGNNTEIDDYNIRLYLQMLEHRIRELILNVYYTQKNTKRVKGEISVINETLVAHAVRPIDQLVRSNPCPLCVEMENVQDVIDTLQFVQKTEEVTEILHKRLTLPDGNDRLHNVSACHLPKSRQIIQKRYQ